MEPFPDGVEDDHEQIVLCHDRESGLRAIIAIHSTVLGPALGGVRQWAFASDEEAVADARRLARAMTYKAAVAGLAQGGGKAVVIGAPGSGDERQLPCARPLHRRPRRALHRCRGRRHLAARDAVAQPRDALGHWHPGRAGRVGRSLAADGDRRPRRHARRLRRGLRQRRPGGPLGRRAGLRARRRHRSCELLLADGASVECADIDPGPRRRPRAARARAPSRSRACSSGPATSSPRARSAAPSPRSSFRGCAAA